MSSVRSSKFGMRLDHLLRDLRALPTISVHPELNGLTLDIVHSLKFTSIAWQGLQNQKRYVPVFSVDLLFRTGLAEALLFLAFTVFWVLLVGLYFLTCER